MDNEINNNLVKSTIKGLEVTCYVVTEDQLENQQRENIFGDIFLLIATLLLGVAVSNVYADITFILMSLGLIFIALTIWFKYLKYNLIKRLKKSPEVKYLNVNEENTVEIIKATYGSETQYMDATEIVRNKLKDNKLDEIVNNEMMGDKDPHEKVRKTLEVIYKNNGKIIIKKSLEKERILIP